MFKVSFPHIRILGAVLVILQLAAACGGGGGTTSSGGGAGGTGSLSGVVTKGPVGGATVTAYGISAGQPGARIGSAGTNAEGNFSLSIGTYAGPVMLQVSGGTYTDEARGTSMSMALGDVMSVAIPGVAAGTSISGIQLTPLTAMAQSMAQHVSGGMTDTNIAEANGAMGNYFSITDIVYILPMNPLVSGSGAGASQDAQNYGMALAAMSEYAQTLGQDSSSAMVTALINDAADAIMDGKAGSMPVQMGGMPGGMTMPSNAGTSALGAAMNAFMHSAQNKSGVMTVALMGKLNGASGQIMGAGAGMTSAKVSGTAFNGPMSRATVTAFAVNGGVPGVQIASTATDGQGRFSMTLGGYSGPVMLQLSGGTYMDEATQTPMTMGGADVMSAVLPMVTPGANVNGVWITPVTSMAQARAAGMSSGMTEATISAANASMGNYFSVGDVIRTPPMNPMVAGAAGSASQDARNYGMTLAAMSEYARALGMANSASMVTAMMSDAADGIMDGKRNGSQIAMSMGGMMGSGMMSPNAGTSGLGAAMKSFLNSAANVSGVTATNMAALVQKLTGSDGHM